MDTIEIWKAVELNETLTVEEHNFPRKHSKLSSFFTFP